MYNTNYYPNMQTGFNFEAFMQQAKSQLDTTVGRAQQMFAQAQEYAGRMQQLIAPQQPATQPVTAPATPETNDKIMAILNSIQEQQAAMRADIDAIKTTRSERAEVAAPEVEKKGGKNANS